MRMGVLATRGARVVRNDGWLTESVKTTFLGFARNDLPFLSLTTAIFSLNMSRPFVDEICFTSNETLATCGTGGTIGGTDGGTGGTRRDGSVGDGRGDGSVGDGRGDGSVGDDRV